MRYIIKEALDHRLLRKIEQQYVGQVYGTESEYFTITGVEEDRDYDHKILWVYIDNDSDELYQLRKALERELKTFFGLKVIVFSNGEKIIV